MLVKAALNDITAYGDTAYDLAMDKTRSCYPAYYDEIKTKDDFIAAAVDAVKDEHSELLLFLLHGRFEGWIQYYWLEEDRYLQLTGCNIAYETNRALEELLEYLEDWFSGYSMYFGFPAENIPAQRFLAEHGFTCLERLWNSTLLFCNYPGLPESSRVKRIDWESFEDFRAIHRDYESNVYWTCDRIYEALDRWMIFVYYTASKPVAAVHIWSDGDKCEVFGLEGGDDAVRKELLSAALNCCKSLDISCMTFLCDDADLSLVQSLPFDTIGQYTCWMKKLS